MRKTLLMMTTALAAWSWAAGAGAQQPPPESPPAPQIDVQQPPAAVDVQQRFQAFIWQRGYERDAFHRMIGEAMITQW